MSGGEALYTDPALVRFYDLDNGWAADCDHVAGLVRPGLRVLDLGCGTGVLAAGLAAQGAIVTGVDPADAMLAVARARPGGGAVRWLSGDARDLRLRETFDLVVMTGHAFQVFADDAGRLAVLRCMAAHLAPSGRFVFDTRNPAYEEWRDWTPRRSRRWLEDDEHGIVTAWNDATWDDRRAVAICDTVYRLAGDRLITARSEVGFVSRDRLAGLIAQAGLRVHDWLGDWAGRPWNDTAPEIIPRGGLAG